MTALNLAKLAVEVWRASGARTETRRDALVTMYAESYWGTAAGWRTDIRATVDEAHQLVKRMTRIDELSYA